MNFRRTGRHSEVFLLGGCHPAGSGPAREIIANHRRHTFRRGPAQRGPVDLHYWTERATAQSRDGFNREFARVIRVLAWRDVQVPPQRVFDAFGARYVAGSTAANMYEMFAAGLVPEHVVKCRNPADAGWRDLAHLTHAP